VEEVPDNREVALSRLQTYLKRQEKHRRISTWNLWATLALLLVCVGGALYFWMKWHSPEAPAAIPLHVSGSGTELRIEWDSKLDSVQKATAGLLEMRESDGTSMRLNVPRDALRIGSALYTRHSDKVEVRLRLLYADRPAYDSVVYFITPLSVAAAKPADVPPAVVGQPAPPATDPQAKDTADRQTRVPTPRRFEPPQIARSAPAPQQSVDLPATPLPTDIGPSSPATAFKLPASSAPVPPPPPAPAVSQPRTTTPPARPRSGRLIWTGDLARNALLSLSSTGASAGWMNGHLPGFPVKISIYPGDLVTGGIEVYVSDPKHSTNAEPPSGRNGWNTVVFKYDAKRIPDIRILEAPSSSNSWNQLVLQNGKRPVSVLVIDWTEAR